MNPLYLLVIAIFNNEVIKSALNGLHYKNTFGTTDVVIEQTRWQKVLEIFTKWIILVISTSAKKEENFIIYYCRSCN